MTETAHQRFTRGTHVVVLTIVLGPDILEIEEGGEEEEMKSKITTVTVGKILPILKTMKINSMYAETKFLKMEGIPTIRITRMIITTTTTAEVIAIQVRTIETITIGTSQIRSTKKILKKHSPYKPCH